MHTFPGIQPLQYITIIHTNAKIAVSTFALAQESSNSMANQRLLPASTAARLGLEGRPQAARRRGLLLVPSVLAAHRIEHGDEEQLKEHCQVRGCPQNRLLVRRCVFPARPGAS